MAATIVAAPAHGQFAVSVSAVSDYRYRGASIGSDQPAVALNLAYDAPTSRGVDAYAGASVTVGRFPGAGLQIFSQSTYVGMAGPLSRGLTWDVGVDNTVLTTDYGWIDHTYNPELYAGLKSRYLSWSLRYSPHYFQDGLAALYAEVDSSVPLSRRWRLVAHGGALTPFPSTGGYYSTREQYDGRFGLDVLFKGAELGLAWTFQRPGYGRLGDNAGKPDALVVTATCFF